MRAVVYVRVSTTDQVENYSLATQEAACREYCSRNGLDVAKVFSDKGVSAKTTDRPALHELLDFCGRKANAIGFVVAYRLDRFARRVTDHHETRAMPAAMGIALRSTSEQIDETPSGRLNRFTLR